jgi:hypothetical protein
MREYCNVGTAGTDVPEKVKEVFRKVTLTEWGVNFAIPACSVVSLGISDLDYGSGVRVHGGHPPARFTK